MAQKFHASDKDTFTWPNGAKGHRPGGPMDCLGPYAVVQNCPIVVDGVEVTRLTAYATGYADTAFSVPACTRYKGKHVGGFFALNDAGVEFRPYDRFKAALDGATAPSLYFLRMSGDYLDQCEQYNTKADALAAFRVAAEELAGYGQTIEASVHKAPSMELVQEYPDFVLSLGPRGGLVCEAA